MATARKAQSAETASALKAAARRVFARQGYLSAKITDITREAGRAAGSFYNHFAAKEELLEALLTDMLAEADLDVYADPEHSEDLRDRAAVRWHVAAYWRFHRAHVPELTALRQAAMVDERFAGRMQEITAADREHLSRHLSHVDGLPGDPQLVGSAVRALLEQFAWTWLTLGGDGSGRELSDDEAIEFLTDFIHRALTCGAAAQPG
ncbi:transcriptional regulator, TetR family [Prauserella sp. Am3]|nr:transcriptional regulator, TetR family [Prauserella sp. Am3]